MSMTGAQIVTAAKLAWKAVKLRISLARKRSAAKAVVCLFIFLASGCARFDPFWCRVGDMLGVEEKPQVEKEAGK